MFTGSSVTRELGSALRPDEQISTRAGILLERGGGGLHARARVGSSGARSAASRSW
jgi:hypothetical protein